MIDQAALILEFKKFLQSEGSSEKTQKNYVADLEDFFTVLHSSKLITTLDQLSEATIQEYIRTILDQGKSIATVNRRLSTLRIFFKCVQAKKLTIHNPMQHIANLQNEEETIPHLHIVKAYEATLRTKGISNITHHKTVVADFLRWVNKHPPS